MDTSEAGLDRIEAQRSTDVSHNTESVPEFLTDLRLSDLYNLPGEYVRMNPEIFSAMRFGNIEYLEKLKSYGTPMACFKNDKGDSILHLAAAWGHLELVNGIVSECPSLLLEPNWKDQFPLHVAARSGHSAVVKALVASVTYFSARLSDEHKETLNLYVLKDKDGDTPLHAALKDINEKQELLIYQKRMRGKNGLIPLMIHWLRKRSTSVLDTSTRQMETAAYLVKVNERAAFLANNDGASPLYLAVAAGNVPLVNAMLNSHGNNVQGKTSKLASRLEGRKSLVHAALKTKNIGVLDVIVNEDPGLVNERDEEGQTCLSVGASIGYYEGICKLLDISVSNVYECNVDGSFPVHIAVEKGHMNVVKEILKRCPDSECLLNNKGQNILHIAAKSGRARSLISKYIKGRKNNHLIEEQDVDGNTPLHLATINWRPRTVSNLTQSLSTETKILNLQNKDGLKALDIAEEYLQPDYILRERLTLMVLLCVYAPRGVSWLPTSGMTLRSRADHPDANKYKDKIDTLLLVSTLVATVTFAAGFTMPGGYNSSAPNLGIATLVKTFDLSSFLIFDMVAMQCSVIAIVALIWAQLGDPALVHRAFKLALPSLYVALVFMSMAFLSGVGATIKPNSVIGPVIIPLCSIFFFVLFFSLAPYVIPQVPGNPLLQRITAMYLWLLLLFVDEDDAEKLDTSGSSHTLANTVEYMEARVWKSPK